MEWSRELNDLLNQCVFECGYEFRDASQLLQSRARTLRLLLDHECVVTPDECQVQWMAINPVEDDPECDWHNGDEGGGDMDELQQMLASGAFVRSRRNSVTEYDEPVTDSSAQSMTEPEIDFESDEDETDKSSPEGTSKPASTTAGGTIAPVDARPAGGSPTTSQSNAFDASPPLLELSISDAELDLLLSSLPAVATADDDDDMSADAKHSDRLSSSTTASEMQWVLSFLTDPDAVAHDDADAKWFLQSGAAKENEEDDDDDNYQFFLHELDEANLLLHAAHPDATTSSTSFDARDKNDERREWTGDDAEVLSARLFKDDEPVDDDNDDEEDEWATVRRSIKSQAVRRPLNATTGAVRSRPPALVSGSKDWSRADTTPLELAALSQEVGGVMETHDTFRFH